MNNEQLIKEFLEFQEVKRKTIIEEQQQTFTPPHDVNSEIPANINVITPDGKSEPLFVDDYSDVNNILDDFKACLQAQNEKGIKEYGVPLNKSSLSIIDYSNYGMEELSDSTQYNRVAHYKLLDVIELLEQVKNIPQVNEALIMLRGEEDDIQILSVASILQ